ncbi:MAG: substrate-binding domain-containing protein [Akkermansiaceae bacterium]
MSQQPGLTPLGKIVVFLFIIACIGAGAFMLLRDGSNNSTASPSSNTANSENTSIQTTIGIAYGTEKQRWLKWAVEEFKNTTEGKKIQVNLIPMGSIEGADAVLSGDKNIHVWSPASAAYKDRFEQDYLLKYSRQPIINKDDNKLVLTPMVFVMWKKRYDAFVGEYGELNFNTIRQAMVAKEGWAGLPEKSDWGYFKFGHTNPKQSNSGLLALVLSAYDYHNKYKDLTASDIVDSNFRKWFYELETGANTKMNSTGNLMREMVSKGASVYDVILVYENLAMSYCENAKGRSGEFVVIYPKKNIWNENPYYIIDAEWSSNDQRKAAQVFYEFLKTEEMQREAVNQGFRPDNLNVPIKAADSPFMKYAKNGIEIEINQVCEPPSGDVITNLFTGWDRRKQQ